LFTKPTITLIADLRPEESPAIISGIQRCYPCIDTIILIVYGREPDFHPVITISIQMSVTMAFWEALDA
jgi:hypothetical protein